MQPLVSSRVTFTPLVRRPARRGAPGSYRRLKEILERD